MNSQEIKMDVYYGPDRGYILPDTTNTRQTEDIKAFSDRTFSVVHQNNIEQKLKGLIETLRTPSVDNPYNSFIDEKNRIYSSGISYAIEKINELIADEAK